VAESGAGTGPSILRVQVLGIPVDCLDMQQALAAVDTMVAAESPGNYLVAINPEKIIAARRDPHLAELIKHAAILIPDGIGVVMACRFLHHVRVRRVPGADLMQRICQDSVQKRQRIFLYGAKEEINRQAVAKLERVYPGIQIVGRSHGYVCADEMPQLVDKINSSQADIVFVALGSPRQEEWMRQFGPKLNARICMGIGGTLDTIVGNVKRAPVVFQRLGLEWLYRLICQPSRIRRQLVLPVFAWLVFEQKIRAMK
jgi:N-acetylglucosaminyldiphosphoundecaprenol N-acetyl-beta-D-mannosaminyltransferase